ncbi:MAG TPA: hypothetical protein VLJ37_09140 [bacterium]|nr:hypothetical protein [bacterium]
MKKTQLLAAILSVLGLAGLAACGRSDEQVIEMSEPSESVCAADADCSEGLVCQEGACVEVVVPEGPEVEPEPEPEGPVACAANDECESGKCSAETLTCVDACPFNKFWKTPVGQVTGACEEFSLTFKPTVAPSCVTDADCQDGYVCALGQCVKPDPNPEEGWM